MGGVLGFLKDGEVDVELTQRVLACGPNLRATFHHAFKDAKDKRRAITEIKRLPQVDRILSSGGTDNWGCEFNDWQNTNARLVRS